jgi:ABC-type transporter lipoprotein component MlaA
MNIQQISNNIDQKLAQLDQQLARLQIQLVDAGDNRDQLLKDQAALEHIKSKLQKSRNIMWQAHELQSNTDQKRLGEKRLLGIGLCVVSGLGLLLLAFIVLAR